MKIKNLLILLLLTTSMLLSGCSQNADPPTLAANDNVSPTISVSEANDNITPTIDLAETDVNITPTVPVEQTESYPDNVIVKDVAGEIQFDWDEAMNNIYIAGKKVSFPSTVADLGEGFGFNPEKRTIENNNGTLTVKLYYRDKPLGIVFLSESNSKDYSVNKQIEIIYFTMDDDYTNLNGIYKFRLGDIVSKSDIIEYFGSPTAEGELGLDYVFFDSNEHHIKFTFNEKGELYCLNIKK